MGSMNADEHQQMMKGEGSRTADRGKVPYLLLDQHTPLHSDFPFQIVHLYHVQLDIYSESSRPEEVLGIPWVTFAVDAHSRRQLAVYSAFNLPRSASYMMALRKCVQHYARLPQILVIDEESGHNNGSFEAFLSEYGITKAERSLTEPDKGSPIKQLFGMTEIDFIEDVLNNTQVDEGLRDRGRPKQTNRISEQGGPSTFSIIGCASGATKSTMLVSTPHLGKHRAKPTKPVCL